MSDYDEVEKEEVWADAFSIIVLAHAAAFGLSYYFNLLARNSFFVLCISFIVWFLNLNNIVDAYLHRQANRALSQQQQPNSN